MRGLSRFALPLAGLLLSACGGGQDAAPVAEAPAEKPATVADARAFVDEANAHFRKQAPVDNAAYWIASTYINEDSQLLASKATEESLAYLSRQVEASKRFNGLDLPEDVARGLMMLKLSTAMPAPSDAAKREELAKIAARMEATYGAGKYCPEDGSQCLSLGDLETIINESRDADELLTAWTGWRTISVPMRKDYLRFVELANEGARELGFEHLGDMWKAGYDMSSDAFEAETERLWGQVEPLYEALHCYVRDGLSEHYGEVMPDDGTIPAHLLGNMWAQQWSNIYPLVEPYPDLGDDLNVTAALRKQKYDPVRMTKTAEDFFTSIGLPSLPASFYEKSMLRKPRDRDVVCHASAWDMNMEGDVRIKMCIEPTEEQFTVIHHELGHIYYYLMYNDLPPLFQTGAHAGFHEAIGDAITLSLTPSHLKQIDLVDKVVEDERAVINTQMKLALDKIAFLPFGKMIDQWRWRVFSGEFDASELNAGWWQLRRQYQGLSAPVERDETLFDPGAKYHIPGNTPYTRYFLAHILQFQIQKAMCDAAGFEGALHECSIYGNKEAGKRLGAMLAMGASRPWPDALQKLTGKREMDAAPLIEYFGPLLAWLEQQNQGRDCGWQPGS